MAVAATSIAATMLAAAAGRLRAQPAPAAPVTADSATTTGAGGRPSVPWDVVPFVGYATGSRVSFWGMTPGRSHLMIGVQFVHPVARTGLLRLAYAPNVVPLFVLTNNPRAVRAAAAGGHVPSAACESTRCGPVYGVAAAPAGLRVDAHLVPGLQLYGAMAVGLVRFGRNVPVAEARRLNATAEWGGGLVVGTGGLAVQLGYKYHHLSNGYTADRNPGVDGRVLHAGVLWRTTGHRARR